MSKLGECGAIGNPGNMGGMLGEGRKPGSRNCLADAAPGAVILAAGGALNNLGRGTAIDGVGIGPAILVAFLVWTSRHDRSAMVHHRIGPGHRGARSAIFESSIFRICRDAALPRAHLP